MVPPFIFKALASDVPEYRVHAMAELQRLWVMMEHVEQFLSSDAEEDNLRVALTNLICFTLQVL